MRDLVYVVIDSARYDSVAEAQTPNMAALGRIERRYSFASWTPPSHLVYLMGLTPHTSPVGIFASEVYKADYSAWGSRLDIADTTMGDFVPAFSLPRFLKNHGYVARAMVSMPIINQHTILARDFDSYRLMPRHDDFGSIIESTEFSPGTPTFYFLNLGEAHYPYMIPPAELARLTGEPGVILRSGEPAPGASTPECSYTSQHLKRFHEAQRAAVEQVDRLLPALFAKCLPDTFVMITADHGELFGEDGYFGHGPICHPKVFEVPFVEGRL